MNRIELYLDKNDRLTLDFYMNKNDEYPMSVLKGEKCYSIISQLCESRILEMKENAKAHEVKLIFKDTILNINDYEQILRKRGTGPIKISMSKFFEEEKKKTFKPKKVKRVNKHVGVEIIAGILALSTLAAVLIHEHAKQKNNDLPITPSTTITYETEATIPNNDEIVNYTWENNDVSNEEEKQIFVDESETNDNSINVCIDYEDRTEEEKGIITKAYYGEIIEKYAKMYGLDSNIVFGIATQERGVHSTKKDPGGATGLMQLQNAVWVGEEITAYNYDLGKYETVKIYEDTLKDVFSNIKIGCMYFQNCMNYMDNNVIAAIQCYNYGYGNMQTVLGAYSSQTGKTKQEILNDVTDYGWMDYRDTIPENEGDRIYIEHVLSWVGPEINLSNQNFKNIPTNLTITNSMPVKQK